MTNINFLFNQAELSFAAYASLSSGNTDQKPQIDALTDAGMSQKQAEEFASRYTEVVTQFNDTKTSFSATVFKDVTGKLTLAIRGTAELFSVPGDVVPTDLDILLHGAGYDQILAMHNWWHSATAQAGQEVQQFAIRSYYITDGAVPDGAVFLYSKEGNGPVPIDRNYYVVATDTIVATGELAQALALDADARVDVTGHSLGGHLAMAFGSMFSNYTNEVTVFNSPGFLSSARNQNFFAALGGHVPTGNVTANVIANEASADDVQWNAIAELHSRPGVTVDIAIEDQAGGNSDEPDSAGARNHSQMIL